VIWAILGTSMYFIFRILHGWGEYVWMSWFLADNSFWPMDRESATGE
jgi:hypothetical protein